MTRIMRHPTSKNRGFALVVALSLMAFVLLLLLTISGLTQVEIQQGNRSLFRLKAKCNAQLGVMVALGQLQRLAGPDQRVTARSDLLGAHDGDLRFGEVENPYLTAVWDVSGASDHTPGERPTHDRNKPPAFLISGNEAAEAFDSPGPVGPATDLTDPSDTVRLVAAVPRSSGDTTPYSVRAPKVPIFGPNKAESGNLAYWVGDEGVKARVNLINPYEINNRSDTVRWRQNHSASIALLDGPEDGFPGWVASREDIASLISRWQSVDQAAISMNLPLATALREKFHDVSFISTGVLADTRDGGLRRNLTRALMADGGAASGLSDLDWIFPQALDDQAQQNAYRPFIEPRWGLLRDYMTTSEGFSETNPVVDARLAAPGRAEIAPVITRFQLSIVPVRVGDPAGSQFRVYLCLAPAVSLWNPYNVTMRLPQLMLLYKPYNGGGTTVDLNDGDRFSLGLRIGAEPLIPVSLPSLQFYLPATDLPPGRSVIFSRAGLDDGLRPLPNGPSEAMEMGFNPLGYYYFDTGIDAPDQTSATRIAFNTDDGSSNPIRNEQNILHLIAPNDSGQLEVDRDNILVQHLDVSAWSEQFSAFYGAPSPTQRASVLLPQDGANYAATSWNAFQSPRMLVVNAMKFSSKYAGGLIDLDKNHPIRWLAHYNPRATLSGAFLNGAPELSTNVLFSGSLHATSDAEQNFNFPSGLSSFNYSPVGGLWTSNQTDRAILFDLPLPGQRFTALTQLTHANLMSSSQNAGGGFGPRGGRSLYPAFPLGNSLASPHISEDALTLNAIDERTYLYDLSYLLNDTLYDRYFLTGVRPGDALLPDEPLPNARLQLRSNKDPAEVKEFNQAAGALMLKGAFNVNSTSVEAWASFLGGQRGTDVGIDQGSAVSAVDAETPFTWNGYPFAGRVDEGELGADEPASLLGFRALGDAEVRWLAERIVEQVKARGPFPSLSAFINRTFFRDTLYRQDLSSTTLDELELSGALQAALDASRDSQQAPNRAFSEEGIEVSDGDYLNSRYPEAVGGSRASGVPAYLTQAHLLSQIDSAIAVRSDTFVIRAYGESLAPNGSVEAKVWCEAYVQRLPDYVDSSDAPENSTDLSPTNERFGRQFALVGFRWIDAP